MSQRKGQRNSKSRSSQKTTGLPPAFTKVVLDHPDTVVFLNLKMYR